MNPVGRVILDFGAQIIELSNQDVVWTWLCMTESYRNTDKSSFFNDNLELSVLDRKGHVEIFQISSFAEQLGLCFIFLDGSIHQRDWPKASKRLSCGCDTRITSDKNRLVQNNNLCLNSKAFLVNTYAVCMRMRKLDKGQSVIFWIPKEIKAKSLNRLEKKRIYFERSWYNWLSHFWDLYRFTTKHAPVGGPGTTIRKPKTALDCRTES